MNGTPRAHSQRHKAPNSQSPSAVRRRLLRASAWVLPAILLMGCGGGDADAPEATGTVQAFTNANIFDGTGAAVVANGTILVQDGKITAVGADVEVPEGAQVTDLGGRYVIPGLVNTHAHVDTVDSNNSGFSALEQLEIYAHYGTTTLLSLGENNPFALNARDSSWTIQSRIPRILASGKIYTPMTPEDARAIVDTLASQNVDFVKIRVDDFLGAQTPMPPAAYTEVIRAATEHQTPVAVHLYKLEDGKGVLRAGAKLIAHSIRDVPVDQEFIDLLRENDACLAPTLVREFSTYAYAERPDFFEEPFFREKAAPASIDSFPPAAVMEAQATSAGSLYWKEHQATAEANVRALRDGGVTLAYGDDTSTAFPGRWQGYFGHVELEMLVNAGLTPQEALQTATANSARCIGLEGQVGTLVPGAWGDFLVLNANPLEDILNTRQIHSVWMSGQQLR